MTSDDHPERLMIALEPEAASIYVRKLRLYQLVPEDPVTQTLMRGSSASTRANRYSSYYASDSSASGMYSDDSSLYRATGEVYSSDGLSLRLVRLCAITLSVYLRDSAVDRDIFTQRLKTFVFEAH